MLRLRKPSRMYGFARTPSESMWPSLWPDYAWVPALGETGKTLFDVSGRWNSISYGVGFDYWGYDSRMPERNNPVVRWTTDPLFTESGIPLGDIPDFKCSVNAHWAVAISFCRTSAGTNRALFGKWVDAPNLRQCRILFSAGDPYKYEIWFGGNRSINGTDVFSYDKFYTIVLVCRAVNLWVWAFDVTGALVTSNTGSGSVDQSDLSQSIMLGSTGSPTYGCESSFFGAISSCLFYKRYLGESEARALGRDNLLPFRQRLIRASVEGEEAAVGNRRRRMLFCGV